MVDDQFAPLSEKIQAAIASVSSKPVTFLMNTHFHGDHTGGNANFEAKGTMIVAQENVRKRLAENKTKGLPVITFSDDATFYMNGNDIFLTHVHNAHTDGDAYITTRTLKHIYIFGYFCCRNFNFTKTVLSAGCGDYKKGN